MSTVELKHKFLKSRNWSFNEGWAINTAEMNPEAYDPILFRGESLVDAIGDYVRQTTWWEYDPSLGEVCFEDIDEAIEYEEDNSGFMFDAFCKAVGDDDA